MEVRLSPASDLNDGVERDKIRWDGVCCRGAIIVKIYLDNCCYNRPYDDQSQLRIHQEAEAKLYVQDKIAKGELELVTSFMLDFENAHRTKIQ